MAIRLPLQTIISSDNSAEVGAGSVGGGVIVGPFLIPQDTDNIVVKFSASLVGGISAQFQTTDDGGLTWFGVARTSVVSNAVGDNVQWMSIPVISSGTNSSSVVATGSVISGGGIGSAQPSTLASGEVTGLPILSPTARIILQITGNITSAASNSLVTQVKVNNQDATA